MKNRFNLWLALFAAILFLTVPAGAQDYSHIRIVRLSFAEGTVQYQRPGQDWQQASLNLPIQEGFSLRTLNGYAEIEFEQSLSLRLGTNSTVEFSVLALENGGRVTRVTVSQGAAFVDASLRHGDAVVVASPQFAVNVPHNGRFRVDATPAESWVSVFHGKVAVDSGTGAGSSSSTFLAKGHTLHEASASTEVAANPPQDDFDKWVAQREQAVDSAQNETHEVLGGSYTEGFADLYDYGLWSDIPGYGAGWVPYGMGASWMPFSDGQWAFMGSTGWNWVSAEPWGWLPYHFGSWVNAPGVGWAWLPVGAPTYLPATATWVQVNNQLGWIPMGPPATLNPKRSPVGGLPTAILASGGSIGVIRPGTRVPLNQAGLGATLLAHAPAAGFVAPGGQVAVSVNASRQAVSAAFVPSVTRAGLPPALRAPSGALAQARASRLSAVPHAMLAPHSLPAPAIARGAATAGFRQSFGGEHAAFSAASSGASGGFRGGASRPGGTNAGGGTGQAAHAAGSAPASGGASSGHH